LRGLDGAAVGYETPGHVVVFLVPVVAFLLWLTTLGRGLSTRAKLAIGAIGAATSGSITVATWALAVMGTWYGVPRVTLWEIEVMEPTNIVVLSAFLLVGGLSSLALVTGYLSAGNSLLVESTRIAALLLGLKGALSLALSSLTAYAWLSYRWDMILAFKETTDIIYVLMIPNLMIYMLTWLACSYALRDVGLQAGSKSAIVAALLFLITPIAGLLLLLGGTDPTYSFMIPGLADLLVVPIFLRIGRKTG